MTRAASAPLQWLRGVGQAIAHAASGLTFKQMVAILRSEAGGVSKVAQPMAVNAWVNAAITRIATTLSGLDWRIVAADDPSRVITSGAALELMTRPDTDTGYADMIEEFATHLMEGGEAHVIDPDGGMRPRRLLIAGRREMTEAILGGGAVAWTYSQPRTGRRITPAPDSHWYMRMPNPYDPIRGLAPLQAAGLGLSMDYQAAVFQIASLANGQAPGGLYKFTNPTNAAERKEFLDSIRAKHSGAENANRPLALSGVDYQDITRRTVDLELFEGRRYTREEIFAVLGVPPVLANVFDAAHYNVAEAAQQIFLINTIGPLARKTMRMFNDLILPRVEVGVMCVIDLGSHPVAQAAERSKATALRDLLSNGVPYNEAITFLGLPFTPQKWGEQSFIQAGVDTPDNIIAGVPGFGPLETPAEDDDDETPEAPTVEETDDADDADDDTAAAYARHVAASLATERRAENAQIARAARAIRGKWLAHFRRQERMLIANVKREVGESAGGTILIASEKAERIAQRILLNIAAEKRQIQLLFKQYASSAIEATLRDELKRLRIPAAEIDAAVRKAMRGRLIESILRSKQNKIAAVELTTRKRVKQALVTGLREGESVQDLAGRIRKVMNGSNRALTIARTEAGQAVSSARFVAAAAAGAQRKAWITGANPRDTHVAAGERYGPAQAIPMNEAFEVGGVKLMYPRDPRGAAGEIINCNCVMLTVRGKADATGATRWIMVNATRISWSRRRVHRRAA